MRLNTEDMVVKDCTNSQQGSLQSAADREPEFILKSLFLQELSEARRQRAATIHSAAAAEHSHLVAFVDPKKGRTSS